MSGQRWILHVDMDAFFAAIEQRDRPEYQGKPVMVGAAPNQRGIIATCSYEARKFGVHSAMPSRTAGKLCPQGIFIPPDIEKYRQESHQIMAILRDFTPQVEIVSIDEAFLDVTTVRGLLGDAAELARKIKDRIHKERRLTASIGVAPNKFLAKLASDLKKPDGLTIITEENKLAVLAPLPVGKLWCVGVVTQKLLEQNGFKTIGDIQGADPHRLESLLAPRLHSGQGNQAGNLQQLALGNDERPVETETEAKSIGSEHTFETDTTDTTLLHNTLLFQAEEIAGELRKRAVGARTLTLKLRYSDFATLTRQTTLDQPTQDEVSIYNEAIRLLRNEKVGKRMIRLIGLSASGLAAPHLQLDLFDQSLEKRRRLASAMDAIRARHGKQAIRRLGH